ncbi:MAG: type II toxin-antitoxin system VapC family toxin [Thiobacillaceae bacterium]|nr:type II toxin-antitoxin system VapC family toxin [Thiobacillaceae bacterium]MCX7671989.1 type II toxin-antitoxin system VapC family toxin [Thiobacillaceae bacterium]MDW8322577.1 type II toxin-antitoxin system VapC family toxin [Burkholderiales bacterium]
MKLLLDTHTFLWWVADAPELSEPARAAVADGANTCYLSLASCWEMAFKSSLGKLQLNQPIERFIPEHLQANGFDLLPIEFRHTARVETLPLHHRDPFDRLLVAQAQIEKLVIVSRDTILSAYGVRRIW